MEYKTVKIKKGTFYLSSKVDGGEGWEKRTFENPKNKEETLVYYHKNLSVEGKLLDVKMEEDKFMGKVCKIFVKAENDVVYVVNIPVYAKTKKVKATNPYLNSIIGSLLKLKKGLNITMLVNSKRKDKNGELYKSIVILNPDNTVVKSDYNFKDVPRWKKQEEEDEFGEKTIKWDATDTNKFYIKKFKKVLDNFKLTDEEALPF